MLFLVWILEIFHALLVKFYCQLWYKVTGFSVQAVHSVYPQIHFRILRAVNPLSQLCINWKFQKYISLVFTILIERLLWTLSLLRPRAMNYVILWCVLALQRLLHFIFISLRFFCLFFCCCFFVDFLLRYWSKFVNTYNKAV